MQVIQISLDPIPSISNPLDNITFLASSQEKNKAH